VAGGVVVAGLAAAAVVIAGAALAGRAQPDPIIIGAIPAGGRGGREVRPLSVGLVSITNELARRLHMLDLQKWDILIERPIFSPSSSPMAVPTRYSEGIPSILSGDVVSPVVGARRRRVFWRAATLTAPLERRATRHGIVVCLVRGRAGASPGPAVDVPLQGILGIDRLPSRSRL